MAQNRYYSATAQPTALVATITPTQTTIQLQATIGLPVNLPFLLALDYGNSAEEVTLVTAIAGTTATITRAYDGTTAQSHNVGAPVQHVSSAIDFTEAGVHIGATAGVHGVTGSVVGTTDTQTLSNKTLTSPTINGTVNGAITTGGVGNSVTFGNGFTSNGNPGVFNAGATFNTVAPTFPVGLLAGSTSQLSVDASGNLSTSGTIGTGAITGSSLTTTGATSTGSLSVTGNATVTGNLNPGGIGGFLFARKPSDTSRASTTTLTADPDLTIAVAANAVYVWRSLLMYSGPSGGPNIQFSWTIPASAALFGSILAQPTAGTSTVGPIITDLQGVNGISGSSINLVTIGAGTSMTAPWQGILTTGASAGSVTLTWCQASSNASNTTLKANSFLYFERVA